MSTDAGRRSRLLSVKLRTLVREHLGCTDDEVGRSEVFGGGAALIGADSTWILFDAEARPSLGAALAWVSKNGRGDGSSVDSSSSGVSPVHLLVEHGSGLLARRAALFDAPVTVWHVAERMLLPAVPEPYPLSGPTSPDHLAFVDIIASAGADPMVEHGVVTGEVRGLEICRVVDDPTTGTTRLEVGMGAHDREAFAMVHGDVPTTEALARVVAAVLPHREPGADPHPFNQFAAERLLRWRVCREPAMVGCATLAPAEPPVARTNVKDAVPCVALGTTRDGDDPVTVVFAHGVDLDVVPFAVDAAAYHGTGSVLVATRSKDAVGIIERMAGTTRIPVRFGSVPG